MKSGGFAAVPRWLYERDDVSGHALLVYGALACFADDVGACWPSHATLAKFARCSRRSVISALAELRQVGALDWEQRTREDGGQGSNVYRLAGPPVQDMHRGVQDMHGGPVQDVHTPYAPTAHELEPLELEPLPQASDDAREDVDHLCSLLSELMTANGVRAPKVTKDWRTQARLLLDRDGIPLDLAERVMRWCQQDTFWRSNVLGMPKFRAKFDQLRLRMEADAPKQPEPELPNPYRAQEAEERRQLLAWLDALGVTEAEWNARRAADDRAWLEALKARVPA